MKAATRSPRAIVIHAGARSAWAFPRPPASSGAGGGEPAPMRFAIGASFRTIRVAWPMGSSTLRGPRRFVSGQVLLDARDVLQMWRSRGLLRWGGLARVSRGVRDAAGANPDREG